MAIRVGVVGGMATALLPVAEVRTAALEAPGDIDSVVLHDATRELQVLNPQAAPNLDMRFSEWAIGRGELTARIAAPDRRLTTYDRLVLLLPLIMWVAAALITLAARQPFAGPAAQAPRASRHGL